MINEAAAPGGSQRKNKWRAREGESLPSDRAERADFADSIDPSNRKLSLPLAKSVMIKMLFASSTRGGFINSRSPVDERSLTDVYEMACRNTSVLVFP